MILLIAKNSNSIFISKEGQIMSKWSSRIMHGISQARSYNVIMTLVHIIQKAKQCLYNCNLIASSMVLAYV